MTFAEQCEQGARADAALREGRYAEAREAYTQLAAQVAASQRVDAFIVSKAALGLLIALIHEDARQQAHSLWTSTLEDDHGHGVLSVGIHGLENGQVSVHDLMVYFLVCAYLHSLGTEPEAAVRGVNDFMGRVARHAFERDPSLLPGVLNNWWLHLQEIFHHGLVPQSAAQEWMSVSERYARRVPTAPLTFPPPAPWVVDWQGPGAQVTEFHPDGSVRTVPAPESHASPPRKKGFFARLFGRGD
jgi:hypothetical protein